MNSSLLKKQMLFKCFGIAFFTLLFWITLSITPLQTVFGSTAQAAGLSATNSIMLAEAEATSNTGPTLSITDTTITITDTTFSVNIDFTQNISSDVASTGFSVDYDESCLTFVGESALSNTPPNFNYSIHHDSADTNGEIDLAIWDAGEPGELPQSLPEGSIATLTFQLTCPDPYYAIFNFSTDPAASFGDTGGNDVDGDADGGTVTINVNTAPVANDDPESPEVYIVIGSGHFNILDNDNDVDVDDILTVGSLTDGEHGTTIHQLGSNIVSYQSSDMTYNGPDSFTYQAYDGHALSNEATVNVNVVAPDDYGDCNASDAVTAADFVAIALETLDDDSGLPWYQAYQDYPGSPLGCDANGSEEINATDIIYTVKIFFGLETPPQPPVPQEPESVDPGPEHRIASSVNQGAANLDVTDGLNASLGETVDFQVTLNSQSNAIAAAAFRLEFDGEQLDFDATDADENGLPDAIQFQAPEGMLTLATYDANNGYLDIALIGMDSPMPALADGTIATVSLQVKESATASTTEIQLTQSSLGNTTGQDVAVSTTNGTLSIDQLRDIQLIQQFFIPLISR